LLEAIVIGMCLNGVECTTVSQAYYAQNKPLQEFVRDMEMRAEERLGPSTMQVLVYTLPAAMLVSGQTGVARVGKYFAIEAGRDTSRLLFEVGF